jgi:hypothetical protein
MQYSAYEIFKYWLPLISGFGLVISAWKTTKELFTAWADKLLNNHLHHIEINTAETVLTMKQVLEEQRTNFSLIRDDFHERAELDTKVQQAILTNLEVLRDRQ